MPPCFLCMVNELPPRFLFYKNEGTAEDRGKKISLARFQSVKFRCNTAWKTVACMLVLWKNALITSLLLRRFVFRKVELRRATGDEPQGTMGRVQTAGEARCLLRAFLRAHISIERETSG